MRFIPTKFHAPLDYIVGVALIAAPWIFQFSDVSAAAVVSIVLGIGLIAYSLLTDYELGVWKVEPMAVQNLFDIGAGAFLAASPWIFGFADELALQQHVVGARVPGGTVKRGCIVPRDRNQAEARVIAPEPRTGADSVEERHVEVENCGVGRELVDELDRCQAVRCRADDGELALALDQASEVLEIPLVVVGEQHSDRALGGVGAHSLQPLASEH